MRRTPFSTRSTRSRWIIGGVAICAASACAADTPDLDAIAASTTRVERSVDRDVQTTGAMESIPIRRIAYGSEPQQFADLTVPAASDAPTPVVVLIHGGFWRTPYDLDLMEPLAADLSAQGYAVWNLEYRRIGDDGGGWPGTFDDVASGVDALADAAAAHRLDLDRVAFVGHSAGGHLALWAAGRATLAGAPGSAPMVTPLVAIGQGAVIDLTNGAATQLGAGAVAELLGGLPDEYPDRYAHATPDLGAGPEMVSIVGTADLIVPPPYSADQAQPGGVEVVSIDGADHFAHIDPSSEAWQAVVTRLDAALRPGRR